MGGERAQWFFDLVIVSRHFVTSTKQLIMASPKNNNGSSAAVPTTGSNVKEIFDQISLSVINFLESHQGVSNVQFFEIGSCSEEQIRRWEQVCNIREREFVTHYWHSPVHSRCKLSWTYIHVRI